MRKFSQFSVNRRLVEEIKLLQVFSRITMGCLHFSVLEMIVLFIRRVKSAHIKATLFSTFSFVCERTKESFLIAWESFRLCLIVFGGFAFNYMIPSLSYTSRYHLKKERKVPNCFLVYCDASVPDWILQNNKARNFMHWLAMLATKGVPSSLFQKKKCETLTFFLFFCISHSTSSGRKEKKSFCFTKLCI